MQLNPLSPKFYFKIFVFAPNFVPNMNVELMVLLF